MKPNIDQLRDIHLPALISWWPPAPGWWLLAVLLLAVLLGLYFWYRRYQRNSWRRSALAELAALRQQHQTQFSSSQTVVIELSVLLRRVAINCFPQDEVAMLNGDKWLQFLDSGLGDSDGFQSEQGRLLTTAPYIAEASIAPEALLGLCVLCEKWIKKLPARGSK